MARILVVDDNAFMRTNLKNVLTKAGFEVVAEAADGQAAVTSYQEAKPDLVTLDITMPNMDGVEALKVLRSIDPTARIVMVSAMGQEALVVEAITSGGQALRAGPGGRGGKSGSGQLTRPANKTETEREQSHGNRHNRRPVGDFQSRWRAVRGAGAPR
jgi:two-component system chemotaxis response regulator CheY